MNAMSEFPGQAPTQNNDCKDKITRAEQKEKTARKGQVCKAARAGQPERGTQNETDRTRLPGQNYQNRTASTGLL